MALDLCSTLILTGRSELAVVEEYILSDKKKREQEFYTRPDKNTSIYVMKKYPKNRRCTCSLWEIDFGNSCPGIADVRRSPNNVDRARRCCSRPTSIRIITRRWRGSVIIQRCSVWNFKMNVNRAMQRTVKYRLNLRMFL